MAKFALYYHLEILSSIDLSSEILCRMEYDVGIGAMSLHFQTCKYFNSRGNR